MPQADGLPLFVVLNASSGHDDADDARQAIDAVLKPAGRRYEVLMANQAGSLETTLQRATDLARRHQGALVAAGGDGTINTVAQTALKLGLPLGVVPQGTFNYFSRVHGIPLDTTAATQNLLEGELQPVQAGRVTSHGQAHAFLVNASLGLYPQLLEDREAYKREYGRSRLVAAWAALKTVSTAHRPLRLQLQAAGGTAQTIRTPTLFVGNNALQLQQTGIPGTAALEHGKLVAITLKPVGTLALLGLMLRGAFGQLGDADSVFSFGFERLTVQPAAPLGTRRMKVATDGEVFWLRAPLQFDPWPQPLMLLKPRVGGEAGA